MSAPQTRTSLSAEKQLGIRLRTSCAIEEKSLPAGILDDHDWSIVVLQAAGDLGRASLQHRDILCLHCLTAGWGRGEERRTLVQWHRWWWEMERRGERWRRSGGRNRRNRCSGGDIFNLHLSWDRTFQNKVLKASFICLLFIMWTQQARNGEREKDRGGDKVR